MILLAIIASGLMVAVTLYQNKEQTREYHENRLARKEDQIKQSLNHTLQQTTYAVSTENLAHIFRSAIYKIADVQKINFNIYDLEGQLILSSRPSIRRDSLSYNLDTETLNRLDMSANERYVAHYAVAGEKFMASYSYITDNRFKPIGILSLPYFEDNSFNEMELREFLTRLAMVYFLILVIAIVLAYLISKYITRSLESISLKLSQIGLSKRNEKIHIENPGAEIGSLVNSFNQMIDELDQSAAKLAKGEREQAWREMAKQVAHEIRNPLTPMRLSVQNFERKFNAQDPDISQRVQEYSQTLIQQIDTMDSIASAFSSFATMPAQQKETLDVVPIVKLALEIFNEDYIYFKAEKERIIAKIDRVQLIRVVTNLVKNAIQAVPEVENPRIEVRVGELNGFVRITVMDNGIGVPITLGDKIFEPKFTTKSSGMGLGLGMVKNIIETYGGSISFAPASGAGTVFTILLPQEINSES